MSEVTPAPLPRTHSMCLHICNPPPQNVTNWKFSTSFKCLVPSTTLLSNQEGASWSHSSLSKPLQL